MEISACSQVRARTSVGYGNSTALNITISAEGETGKNIYQVNSFFNLIRLQWQRTMHVQTAWWINKQIGLGMRLDTNSCVFIHLQLILFRRICKLFNYSSCCDSVSAPSFSSFHCGRVGFLSKTTQVQGVHCVSRLPMGLGLCRLLEILLQTLSSIEGRTSLLILMKSEVLQQDQIMPHMRMKRFAVADSCVYQLMWRILQYINEHLQFIQDVVDEFSSAGSPRK